MTKKTALSIAGSDSSGGAGIQADLKTFLANGVYGMTAITAITAQNTTGVKDCFNLPAAMVEAQIDAVFADIVPDAVKIGMVSSAEIIGVIVRKLKAYEAKHIVLDPVMVATSGSVLLEDGAMERLQTELMPLADVITPNLPEAAMLSGQNIASKRDMLLAAEKISRAYSGAILVKGGHLDGCSDDLLYQNGQYHWFLGRHLETKNTHGTGCTLSSAIASGLAKGYNLKKAVFLAKQYITGALEAGLNLGKGNGPLDHGYLLPVERELSES